MNKADCYIPIRSSGSPASEDSPDEIKEEKKDLTEEETNEEIYCKALAKTLCHVAPPVTVGFFAPWGQSRRSLTDIIQYHMSQSSQPKEDQKEVGRNMHSMLSLIWHIIFYLPVSGPTKLEEARYIFVDFDAWEYVGCDQTWAGLVTTLLDEIEGKHIIPFSTFRAFGKKFKKEPGAVRKKWVLKAWSRSFFLWIPFLFVVFTLCAVLLKETLNFYIWVGMGYGMLSMIVSFASPFMWAMKNVCFTLKNKFQREMNRKDLSAQLGFMHSVKEEVRIINRFLRFMTFIEEKEIRVVLKVTNLDRCAPDKVVSVLDAMNILLSSKDAPFISILAADPSILVECIQCSSNTFSNGYLYLDRIVTLPFSLPQMSRKAKRQLLSEILNRRRRKKQEEGSVVNQGMLPHNKDASSSKTAKNLFTPEEIQNVFRYLSNENLNEYIPGNTIQMKRVVNTVLTILTMVSLGFKPKAKLRMDGRDDGLTIEEVVDWVILANCWPCRLSWILQCEEDEWQQKKLEEIQAGNSPPKKAMSKTREGKQQGGETGTYPKGLLDFYERNAWELDIIKHNINKLLELDGDPDLFKIFLQKTHFTVDRARYFSGLLINLDFSLKRQFELLRGLNHITRRKQSASKSPGELLKRCPVHHRDMVTKS